MVAAAAWRQMQFEDDAEEALPSGGESFEEIMSQLDKSAVIREILSEEAHLQFMQGSPTGRKGPGRSRKPQQALHTKPFYGTKAVGGEFERLKTNHHKDLTPWEVQQATAPERSWPTASSDYQRMTMQTNSGAPARSRNVVSRTDGFVLNKRFTSEETAHEKCMTKRPGSSGFDWTCFLGGVDSLQKRQMEWQQAQDVKRKRVQQLEKVSDEEEDMEKAWQQMLLDEHLEQQKRQQEHHQQQQQQYKDQQPRRRRLPKSILVDDEVLTPVQRTPVNSCGSPGATRSNSSPAGAKRPGVEVQDGNAQKLLQLQRQMEQMAKQIAALQAEEPCAKVVEEYGSPQNSMSSPKEACELQSLQERKRMLARELAETNRCLRGLQAMSPQRRGHPPPSPKPLENPGRTRGGPFAGPRGIHKRTDAASWDHKLNSVSKTTYNYLGPGSDGDAGPPMHPLWP